MIMGKRVVVGDKSVVLRSTSNTIELQPGYQFVASSVSRSYGLCSIKELSGTLSCKTVKAVSTPIKG